MAVELLDNINAELLTEKRKVIDFQTSLIKELASVEATVEIEVKLAQSVVKTEIKSYSSALTQTWNVMIYGQEELSEENLEGQITKVLT